MSNDIWCCKDDSNWHGTPILIPRYIKWLVSLVFAKMTWPHMHNRSLHRLPCKKWGLSIWSLDSSLRCYCWHMESGCGWSGVGFITFIKIIITLLRRIWYSMEASVSGVLSSNGTWWSLVHGGELEGEKVLWNFTLASFPRFKDSGVGRW